MSTKIANTELLARAGLWVTKSAGTDVDLKANLSMLPLPILSALVTGGVRSLMDTPEDEKKKRSRLQRFGRGAAYGGLVPLGIGAGGLVGGVAGGLGGALGGGLAGAGSGAMLAGPGESGAGAAAGALGGTAVGSAAGAAGGGLAGLVAGGPVTYMMLKKLLGN